MYCWYTSWFVMAANSARTQKGQAGIYGSLRLLAFPPSVFSGSVCKHKLVHRTAASNVKPLVAYAWRVAAGIQRKVWVSNRRGAQRSSQVPFVCGNYFNLHFSGYYAMTHVASKKLAIMLDSESSEVGVLLSRNCDFKHEKERMRRNSILLYYAKPSNKCVRRPVKRSLSCRNFRMFTNGCHFCQHKILRQLHLWVIQ